MKYGISIAFAFTLMQLFAFAAFGREGDSLTDFSQYDFSSSSDHFEYFWKKGTPISDSDLKEIKLNTERGYTQVSQFLGVERVPKNRIPILLEGDAFIEGRAPSFPMVDDYGIVRLYRFPGLGTNYQQGMPHELVHAFRNDLRNLHQLDYDDTMSGFGFIEEAFAEFVAKTVDPEGPSFPTYGFSLDVVTGYWLTSNKEIPLRVLMDRHDINVNCVAQAYPLRASFFKYLFERFGKEKLLELAYTKTIVTQSIYRSTFGVSGADLITAWRFWALEKVAAIPDFTELAQKYTATDIQYFPVCAAGKDW